MDRDVRFTSQGDGQAHASDGLHAHRMHNGAPDSSLAELLKRLGGEAGDLVRSEIDLAKVEMSQTARQYAMDGAKIAVAASIAWIGLLALTAAAIAGLALVVGSVWAAALIVGAVFLLIGGVLAQRGIAGMKANSLKPEETVRSLERDRNWARREVQDFREGVRT